MRRVPLGSLVFAVALSAFAPAPCSAEDPTPPPAKWQGPDFDRDTITMRDEDAPEGWKALSEEESEKAAAAKEFGDAFLAAVSAAGFPGSEAAVGYRGLAKADGAVATVAYVGFYADPAKVVPLVKDAAAKKGWIVKEVTSPARLIVVLAPEAHREALAAHATRMAGKRLAAAAKDAYQNQNGAEAIQTLAKYALALEPKAADAHFALAFASQPRDPKAPSSAWKKSIEEMRAALAADAAFPLPEDDRLVAMGELGGFLLQSAGDDAVNREAKDLLQKAWEGAHKKGGEKAGIGWRYNLACAHARLKEKDKAFEHLHGVLDVVIKNPVRGISGWWLEDPDFLVLKDDPRWKATVEKYPDTPSRPGDDSGE
jgi:hypothetical protein